MNDLARVIVEEVSDHLRIELDTLKRGFWLDIREKLADVKGEPGKDGVLSEAIPYEDGIYHRGAIVTFRGGTWQANGTTRKSPSEANGWSLVADGVESVDLKQHSDDPRTISVVVNKASGHSHTGEVKLPVIWPKGRWDTGVDYRQLDSVTWNGSAWIAAKDIPVGEPGTSADWFLYVKQGERGKKGEPGADCDMDSVNEKLNLSISHFEGRGTALLDQVSRDLSSLVQGIKEQFTGLVEQQQRELKALRETVNELEEKSNRLVKVYEENIDDTARRFFKDNEQVMRFKGEYVYDQEYQKGDVVTRNNRSWIAKELVVNEAPALTSGYWEHLS